MKVAHIRSHFLPPSETFIYNYVNNSGKYDSHIICELYQNANQFPLDNIIVNRENGLWFEPLMNTLRNWVTPKLHKEIFYKKFYLRALKNINPDVVHIHFGYPGILFTDIVKKYNLPMLVSFYGYDLSSLPYTLGYDVYTKNNLFSNGQIFTAEGNHAKKTLVDLGCPVEKAHRLRIGIRIENYRFEPRIMKKGHPLKILFCGRFVPKKGLLLLIEAISKNIKENLNIELNIIGYGPQEDDAKRLIKTLDIKNNINFLGALKHKDFINECYKNHIFIAPSQKDKLTNETEGGAPTVLLEAQATGMPVVASRHADIPNIVEDNKSGVLFDEGSLDSLFDAILKIYEMNDDWEDMGLFGREFIKKNHDINVVYNKLNTLYDMAIESNT